MYVDVDSESQLLGRDGYFHLGAFTVLNAA
jgi:hypothetical protein